MDNLSSDLTLHLQYKLSLERPGSSFLWGALNLQSLFLHKFSFSETHIESTRPTFFRAIPIQTNYSSDGTHQTNKSWWISANINTDALELATRFERNCGPTYVFTKKNSISTLCFGAKRVDELAKKLWQDYIHRKLLVWPCWLRIAQLFRSDLWVWLHQLPRAIRFT